MTTRPQTHFIAVGLGGALGGGSRYLLTLLPGATYPAAILAINVLGALALPLIAQYALPRYRANARTRLLITTGAISSFTTFSAISGEMVQYVSSGANGGAALYVAVTFAAGLVAAALGHYLAGRWSSNTSEGQP